ncbi:SDR family NAD(P)-dependent oxidoreductase [Streptomyces sp. NPDC056169]|uniref:SDR family NAD(P)-dependent oxidoreductase n=1 Tax=Streptomyces sp. NPDC056169 TaxID=3345734 RepID=UPI0035D654BD
MSTAVVVGAGPGIGKAVAARFAREGYSVAVIARTKETVTQVAEEIRRDGGRVLALTADSTDEEGLRAALDRVGGELGPVDAAVYNAALIRSDAPGELGAQGQLDAWAVNVVGALTTASHVAPGMAERGHGTILVTGGMPRINAGWVSLGLGKFGVRTLVDLLDAQYGPAGVHVASVTVPGAVAPGTAFDPDDIAEHYWRLHTQPQDAWEREVVHGGVPAAR